jgi:hypothetical protein
MTPFSALPEGRFDGVVCTDVLEHCPEEDLPWIVGELFGYARLFVFANVACYPAAKKLPNGENAHCTIRRSSSGGRLSTRPRRQAATPSGRCGPTRRSTTRGASNASAISSRRPRRPPVLPQAPESHPALRMV